MFDNAKINVLDKLIATGIKTKSELLYMSAADMVYSIPDLEANELGILCKIQNSVRENNLFEYLCEKEEGENYA